MDTVIAKNQSQRVSMFWIILIVPGSPVSNLLALLGLRPEATRPDNRGSSICVSDDVRAKFPVSGWLSLSPPAQNALLPVGANICLINTTTAFDSFQQPYTRSTPYDIFRRPEGFGVKAAAALANVSAPRCGILG